MGSSSQEGRRGSALRRQCRTPALLVLSASVASLPVLAPSRPRADELGFVGRAGAAPRRCGAQTSRRARVDGPFGVLDELPAPWVEAPEVDLHKVYTIVQAADSKRGVDIVAFNVPGRFKMVIVTALSRPQMQAIANTVVQRMKTAMMTRADRPYLHMRRGNIRDEARTGIVSVSFANVRCLVMTPTQRAYYDFESKWRDEEQLYEPYDLSEVLRPEGYGHLRLQKRLGMDTYKTPAQRDAMTRDAMETRYFGKEDHFRDPKLPDKPTRPGEEDKEEQPRARRGAYPEPDPRPEEEPPEGDEEDGPDYTDPFWS